MNQNELRAISQLVADLNADIHNQVRMLHDRVTSLEGRVAVWEQWGGQVNEAIDEIVGRVGALQRHVVETVTTNAYQSEITEHYRRFVMDEAVRVGVELKDLQRGLKRKQREQIAASMDPMVPVDVDNVTGE